MLRQRLPGRQVRTVRSLVLGLLVATCLTRTGDAVASEVHDEWYDPHAPNLDTTGTPPLPEEGELPPPSAEAGEKRPVPDYDGREEESPSAGEVLVWVPRVLFYPVHLTLNWVVRWPLVKLMTVMEEHYVLEHVMQFFTWAEGKAGFFPTAFYEFGLTPSVGFYTFYEDLFGPGSKLILRGGFWGDKQQVALESRFNVFRDGSGTIFLTGLFSNRPDHPFYGVGYRTFEAHKSNFELKTGQALLGLQATLKDLNRFTFSLGYRYASLGNGRSPSIGEIFDVQDDTRVPGFGEYHLLSSELKLELDTRSPHRDLTPGTGLRLELSASYSIDPANPDLHFLHWGGELSGFLDLSGINHVVGLRLYTGFLETTGDATVPLTELVILGGAEHMRAFLNGRFRGDSAFVLTAEYRYPIWAYLDAELFLGLGNTFGSHLEGFAWDRMFLNWGIGVRTNGSRDVSFDILVAFGSNRLDAESFLVDRIGFVIGVNQGF